MNLGQSLFTARKNCGLTQEETAAKLGVSRQTISKWETDETLPDIRQAKSLAVLYHLSLDELIDFDADVTEIRQVIQNTSQATQEKIDWRNIRFSPPTSSKWISQPTPPACRNSSRIWSVPTATAPWTPCWC